jgi:hypothetical protein
MLVVKVVDDILVCGPPAEIQVSTKALAAPTSSFLSGQDQGSIFLAWTL